MQTKWEASIAKLRDIYTVCIKEASPVGLESDSHSCFIFILLTYAVLLLNDTI